MCSSQGNSEMRRWKFFEYENNPDSNQAFNETLTRSNLNNLKHLKIPILMLYRKAMYLVYGQKQVQLNLIQNIRVLASFIMVTLGFRLIISLSLVPCRYIILIDILFGHLELSSVEHSLRFQTV